LAITGSLNTGKGGGERQKKRGGFLFFYFDSTTGRKATVLGRKRKFALCSNQQEESSRAGVRAKGKGKNISLFVPLKKEIGEGGGRRLPLGVWNRVERGSGRK